MLTSIAVGLFSRRRHTCIRDRESTETARCVAPDLSASLSSHLLRASKKVQRNGRGHLRGYAILRLREENSQELATAAPDRVRATLLDAFIGWASSLTNLIECGVFIAARSLYALPIGMRWRSRPGVTLLGDSAHLMSPFGGEGVNLALADAADLADALTSAEEWQAVSAYEKAMVERAMPAAEGAAVGLKGAISTHGVTNVLGYYRARGAT